MSGYGVRSRFSVRQAGRAVAVDVLALSPQARTFFSTIDPGSAIVVQAQTKYFTAGVPVNNLSNPNSTTGVKLVGVSYTQQTAPAVAGGTATVQVDVVASDGSTTVNLVAATSLLGLTSKVALQLAMAATPTIPTGSMILITVVTSNNSVGTADVGSSFTLGFEPVEDALITDSSTDSGLNV